VDLAGHGGGKGSEEVAGHTAGGLLVQLGEGELGGSVDGHEEVELALFGSHFGDVDVKEADRMALELGTPRLVARGVGQTRDAFAIGLEPMAQRWLTAGGGASRRARQMRKDRLESLEAILDRRQRMAAEATMTASSSTDSTVDLGSPGPVR
jgi:hypothetical protein